jgi:hypothetical protein
MTKHFRVLLVASAALLASAGVAMMRANDSLQAQLEQQLEQPLTSKGEVP